MESTLAPQAGRLDRHVRRSVLRVGEGASRHRIAYSLEEALRLATLPGEEEGRIYCFRRISLTGIPAEASRRVWAEQVQQLLGTIAAQAVHASDPNAGSANAVYFNHLEEALETLLRKAVRAAGNALWSAPDWFSNSLIGTEPDTSYALQIPAIVERLRASPMPPAATAAILFAALGNSDPVSLLSAIPLATIREWIQELDQQKTLSAIAPPVQLPSEIRTALQHAASHFGWKDPATVWLAAQAVVCILPGAGSSGTSVKRARETLRVLEEEQLRKPPDRSGTTTRSTFDASALVFDDDLEIAAALIVPLKKDARSAAPQELADLPHSHSITGETSTYEPSLFSVTESDGSVPLTNRLPAIPNVRTSLLGEATQVAGLYFLLNALRALGIVTALETSAALAEANLPASILRSLADETGVQENDPILLCLGPQVPFILSAESLANLTQQPEAWPRGFASSRRTVFDSNCLLRLWTIATKRWLWRMGRLTVSDVIRRSGRVWLTRTDLDVTFPLDAADLRIRRIGLDIDPGWLPWFGECGRVVRFHYRDREPEDASC